MTDTISKVPGNSAEKEKENTQEKTKEQEEPRKDETFCNAEGASILLSIFNPTRVETYQGGLKPAGGGDAPKEAGDSGEPGESKTASVKFMITAKDEKELRELGFTQEQIHKLKPEEAAQILRAKEKKVDTKA